MRRGFDPRFGEGVTGVVSRYRSLVLLAAIIVGQLLVMAYQLRHNQDIPLVRAAVVYVVSPIQKGLLDAANGARNIWGGYLSLWGTHRRNEALNRALGDLKLENQRLREQAAEGRRLQVLFDLRQQLPLPTIAAQVLSTGASETARIITINKGADSGIQPDFAVLVPDGLVGKVLHVFPDTAQVLLITDPYSGVACLIGESRLHGILKGRNQPLPMLGYVPNGDEVKPGEMVFTSGEDQVFPKGIPVGVVVSAAPGMEFQQITVRPVAPLNRLEDVLVIGQSGGDVGKFPVAEKSPVPEAATEVVFGPPAPEDAAAQGTPPAAVGAQIEAATRSATPNAASAAQTPAAVRPQAAMPAAAPPVSAPAGTPAAQTTAPRPAASSPPPAGTANRTPPPSAGEPAAPSASRPAVISERPPRRAQPPPSASPEPSSQPATEQPPSPAPPNPPAPAPAAG